jgi:hypothetical protein
LPKKLFVEDFAEFCDAAKDRRGLGFPIILLFVVLSPSLVLKFLQRAEKGFLAAFYEGRRADWLPMFPRARVWGSASVSLFSTINGSIRFLFFLLIKFGLLTGLITFWRVKFGVLRF